MAAMRDQLHHLVDELPDDQVESALALVQGLRGGAAGDQWPPSWFGAITSDRDDVAATSQETLKREFGARS